VLELRRIGSTTCSQMKEECAEEVLPYLGYQDSLRRLGLSLLPPPRPPLSASSCPVFSASPWIDVD
jgi:hypothetical protein